MASTLLRTVPRALPKLTVLHQQRLTPLVSLNIARMATNGTRVATLDASGMPPIDWLDTDQLLLVDPSRPSTCSSPYSVRSESGQELYI